MSWNIVIYIVYMYFVLSRVRLFVTAWTVACQTLQSVGFPSKNIRVGCHFPLQGIFLTQGSNPHLLHCQADFFFNHWATFVCIIGFSGGSDSKESTCNTGDQGSIPGLRRSLEKVMATHSSILAWRIPWMKESGAQFIGSQRAGKDWTTRYTHNTTHICVCMCVCIHDINPFVSL